MIGPPHRSRISYGLRGHCDRRIVRGERSSDCVKRDSWTWRAAVKAVYRSIHVSFQTCVWSGERRGDSIWRRSQFHPGRRCRQPWGPWSEKTRPAVTWMAVSVLFKLYVRHGPAIVDRIRSEVNSILEDAAANHGVPGAKKRGQR